jgi:hypothetical protein
VISLELRMLSLVLAESKFLVEELRY